MAYVNKVTKHPVDSIRIDRAANGWVIEPSYDGFSDRTLPEIASDIPKAILIIQRLMQKPHVTSEEVWEDE